ncbi:hypothetical protein ACWKSP_11115 [Micromonosporaceae bacterium Da 78-11]
MPKAAEASAASSQPARCRRRVAKARRMNPMTPAQPVAATRVPTTVMPGKCGAYGSTAWSTAWSTAPTRAPVRIVANIRLFITLLIGSTGGRPEKIEAAG